MTHDKTVFCYWGEVTHDLLPSFQCVLSLQGYSKIPSSKPSEQHALDVDVRARPKLPCEQGVVSVE